jgi:hypothetical protein
MKGNPMRVFTSLVALACLSIAVAGAQAQPASVGGNWKVSFLDGQDQLTFWLVKLEDKDGKLSATVDASPKIPPTTIQNPVFSNGTLSFTLELGGQALSFNLKPAAPSEGQRLRGTMQSQGGVVPVQLIATKEGSAKGFEVETAIDIPKGGFKELKEEIAKRADDFKVFATAQVLALAAAREKVSAADLKAALAPVLTTARSYGEWYREQLLQLARQTVSREGYAGLSEEYAREALKELGKNADSATQLRHLDLIAYSLFKQSKKDELSKLRDSIDKLELQGHEENEKAGLGYTPTKLEGRKGQKVVLVELFTGAHCPPCVAADLAFEGLAKSYNPSEVVLLQYHLHIPAPDPLTTPDTEARAQYYGKDVRGTPSVFFGGKAAAVPAAGGGFRQHAADKYKQYREVIDPLLAEDSKVALKVDARQAGDHIDISAVAAGHKPSETLKLRFALVEPWVRFAGSNGLSYHAHVVRALPGGPAGFSLAKDAKPTVKVDLAELRQNVSRHLDKEESLDGQRLFSYRNLRVVAFLQDDDTKEVLHAVDVPVTR